MHKSRGVRHALVRAQVSAMVLIGGQGGRELVSLRARRPAQRHLGRAERQTTWQNGRYAPSALAPLLRYVNQTLLAWALRKFKRFRAHKIRASQFSQKLSRQSAHLFVHWRLGMTGVFA
jgi:hypothetical protein